MDTKAAVKVGPFSRRGKSRLKVAACDHDFEPEAQVTPVGIFLPEHDELFLECLTSKVTADALVDTLARFWQRVRPRFPHVTTLVVNQDNGPENHSRRTQFMHRLVEFAQEYQLTVRLAYYPPYHSKYNPVERCFGVLEMHWNGSLLETVETVVEFAGSMRWKGGAPEVRLVTTTYPKGVKLTKAAMAAVEARISRLPGLEKWFVDIPPSHPATRTN